MPPLIPRDESDGLRRFVPSREQFLKPVGDFRPALMVALWLWATAEGVGSARQLERLCAEHLAYRWLCGGVEIDHHTLREFRLMDGDALDGLLARGLAALVEERAINLELVSLEELKAQGLTGASFGAPTSAFEGAGGRRRFARPRVAHRTRPR